MTLLVPRARLLWAPPERQGGTGRPAAKLKVRVVDDEQDCADSLKLLLEMNGYDASASYDGLSALAADAPDVLIVDIELPDISGYELARRVRADPRFTRTFLIGLSGFDADEDRRRAEEAGFDRYLAKPVDLAKLRKTIDEM